MTEKARIQTDIDIDGRIPYVNIVSTQEHLHAFLRRRGGADILEAQEDNLAALASGETPYMIFSDEDHDYILVGSSETGRISLQVFYKEAEPQLDIGGPEDAPSMSI